MATQYDPIAKDESLNTTEATPRNIADVLKDELVGIKNAISGGGGSGTGLWVLNGHTASGTGLATWNTDTRVTKSVLLSIQVEISGVWFILSQGQDIGSIAQQADGYPQAYIVNSTFYDKDCRAVFYQTEE